MKIGNEKEWRIYFYLGNINAELKVTQWVRHLYVPLIAYLILPPLKVGYFVSPERSNRAVCLAQAEVAVMICRGVLNMAALRLATAPERSASSPFPRGIEGGTTSHAITHFALVLQEHET